MLDKEWMHDLWELVLFLPIAARELYDVLFNDTS
jgi:hypothetical protein